MMEIDAAVDRLNAALAGRYKLERVLGRGGMATVYLAEDLRHGRAVALKVLHAELAATLGPERFLREIRTAARLQHPHILPVHDSGEAAGLLWYTMPRVDGESLRDRLRREAQLPIHDAVRIARDVALALDHAHQQSIIHRDVKPENILLADGHALLADFGVAKATATGDELRTETGFALGTPLYMSPEQAAADRRVDGRSDLYSLGSVLYEMLAGEPPYSGPSPQAIIARRLSSAPLPPRRLRATVTPGLEHVVLRCLATTPADRYATARELAAALSAAAQDAPAGHTGAGAGPLGFSQRRAGHRGMLVATIALLLLSALALFRRARDSEGPKHMLAVLPFENLGRPDEEYFADGLAEELTSRLANVSGLGVISRTSTLQYKGTRKSLREVGRELGVGYVLEGSVRWDHRPDGSKRVRVTPQLIQVSTDRHVWSDRYDAELAGIFELQAAIAAQVVGALDIALGQPEQRALASQPTDSLRAYEYYLKGNQLRAEGEKGWALLGPYREAAEMYQKAVDIDPDFALAHAMLGRTSLSLYASYLERTDARLRTAREAIATSLRLQPELVEGMAALAAYHSLIEHDDARASDLIREALREQPRNARVLSQLANYEWRAGRYDSAAVHYGTALTYDPRSIAVAMETAWTFLYVQRYAEADSVAARVTTLAPDEPGSWILRDLIAMNRFGRETRYLNDALERLGANKAAQLPLPPLSGLARDSVLARAIDKVGMDAFGGDTLYYHLWQAEWHRLRNRPASMRAHSDSALPLVEELARKDPRDTEALYRLSLVYAGLDRRREAVRALERALNVSRENRHAPTVADFYYTLAELHLRFGQVEKAVEHFERLAAVPSQFSLNFLRLRLQDERLSQHPRFRRLVQR